ncbi:unnamed protein product, partial [Amoebophrya sp. A25]|eukprot:GSA25T00022419001.1
MATSTQHPRVYHLSTPSKDSNVSTTDAPTEPAWSTNRQALHWKSLHEAAQAELNQERQRRAEELAGIRQKEEKWNTEKNALLEYIEETRRRGGSGSGVGSSSQHGGEHGSAAGGGSDNKLVDELRASLAHAEQQRRMLEETCESRIADAMTRQDQAITREAVARQTAEAWQQEAEALRAQVQEAMRERESILQQREEDRRRQEQQLVAIRSEEHSRTGSEARLRDERAALQEQSVALERKIEEDKSLLDDCRNQLARQQTALVEMQRKLASRKEELAKVNDRSDLLTQENELLRQQLDHSCTKEASASELMALRETFAAREKQLREEFAQQHSLSQNTIAAMRRKLSDLKGSTMVSHSGEQLLSDLRQREETIVGLLRPVISSVTSSVTSADDPVALVRQLLQLVKIEDDEAEVVDRSRMTHHDEHQHHDQGEARANASNTTNKNKNYDTQAGVARNQSQHHQEVAATGVGGYTPASSYYSTGGGAFNSFSERTPNHQRPHIALSSDHNRRPVVIEVARPRHPDEFGPRSTTITMNRSNTTGAGGTSSAPSACSASASAGTTRRREDHQIQHHAGPEPAGVEDPNFLRRSRDWRDESFTSTFSVPGVLQNGGASGSRHQQHSRDLRATAGLYASSSTSQHQPTHPPPLNDISCLSAPSRPPRPPAHEEGNPNHTLTRTPRRGGLGSTIEPLSSRVEGMNNGGRRSGTRPPSSSSGTRDHQHVDPHRRSDDHNNNYTHHHHDNYNNSYNSSYNDSHLQHQEDAHNTSRRSNGNSPHCNGPPSLSGARRNVNAEQQGQRTPRPASLPGFTPRQPPRMVVDSPRARREQSPARETPDVSSVPSLGGGGELSNKISVVRKQFASIRRALDRKKDSA